MTSSSSTDTSTSPHLVELLGLVKSSPIGSKVRLEALTLLATVPVTQLSSAAADALVDVLRSSDVTAECTLALTSLINLSAEPTFETALATHANDLALALVPLVSQRLQDSSRVDVRRLASTLLANLSTLEAHTDALCGAADEQSAAPQRLRRLLNLCIAMPNDASLEYIAVTLQNCSRRASVRALLVADNDAALLAALANTVAQGTPVRRRGVAHVLRNMFVDELSRKRLLTVIARPIAPLLAAAKTEQDASALSALVDVAYMLALVEAAHADAALTATPPTSCAPFLMTAKPSSIRPRRTRMSFVIRELTKAKVYHRAKCISSRSCGGSATSAVPQGPAAPLAPALAVCCATEQ
jgi:hypothetical protein